MYYTDKLHLKPNIVQVWTINFLVNDETFESYYSLLSEDEKLRASKFKFYRDKRCYVVTKGVLRLLSGNYLNIDAKTITFEYEKYGKPKFKHTTNLNFNVSHSGDIAIIGFVYDNTIGVDVEKIKNDFDTFEIAANFFSDKEIEELRKIPKPEQHIAFYRCWTRKESFIKAKGSGLSFPLDSFSVSLDSDFEAQLQETKWNNDEKDEWHFHSFKPNSDYIAAVIVNEPVERFECVDLDARQYYNSAKKL